MNKKNLNKNCIKSQKGITIVALAVTIIIILILAAVTLNVALGEESLLEQSQQFSNQQKNLIDSSMQGINDLRDQLGGEN